MPRNLEFIGNFWVVGPSQLVFDWELCKVVQFYLTQGNWGFAPVDPDFFGFVGKPAEELLLIEPDFLSKFLEAFVVLFGRRPWLLGPWLLEEPHELSSHHLGLENVVAAGFRIRVGQLFYQHLIEGWGWGFGSVGEPLVAWDRFLLISASVKPILRVFGC